MKKIHADVYKCERGFVHEVEYNYVYIEEGKGEYSMTLGIKQLEWMVSKIKEKANREDIVVLYRRREKLFSKLSFVDPHIKETHPHQIELNNVEKQLKDWGETLNENN